jgi:hypothetical protein
MDLSDQGGVPRARVGGEQRVTPLELFFDLVFVFALTQVTSFLSDHLTWLGMLQAVALLTAKWVVFGTTLGVGGTFPLQLPVDLSLVGGDTPLTLLFLKVGFALSFMLIPLSIGVAVLRSQLFDIDILINRTLVYGSLTATLLALYLGAIVVLQRLFVVLTGERSTLAVVASTLVIAALFNPLRRRIQTFIDRGFYRSKYDARKTLEAFSSKLREETDLEALNSELVGAVRETMQPAHASLWLRPDTAPKGKPVD